MIEYKVAGSGFCCGGFGGGVLGFLWVFLCGLFLWVFFFSS